MQDQQCVYCLRHKPLDEFSTEHVVPYSFGSFKGALTLTDAVCASCNQYFGDGIDRILARESFEGLQRYELGAKDPKDAKKFRLGRVVLKLAEEGEYKDVLIAPMPDPRSPTGIVMAQVDQAGFLDPKTGRWESYPEWILEGDDWKGKVELHKGQQVRILSQGDEAYDRIKSSLKKHGIDFQETEPMRDAPDPGSEVEVKALVEVDEEIKRVAAKICFNYLTYTQGREFVLGAEFHDVRAYIRYGVGGRYPFVHPTIQPILTGEMDSEKRVMGHLVTVGWSDGPGGVLGQLALFNQLTYRVILTTRYWGKRFELHSGHLYSVGGWEVIELGHAPMEEYDRLVMEERIQDGVHLDNLGQTSVNL